MDTLREEIAANTRRAEELTLEMEALKSNAKDAAAEVKEKKKQEKMAAMMAKFDAVRRSLPFLPWSVSSAPLLTPDAPFSQEGTFSDKEDAIRLTMAKLNAVDPDDPSTALSPEDVIILHRQLAEGQSLLRDLHEKVRISQEDAELSNRRKEDMDQRMAAMEMEYEELLGTSLNL